MSFFLTETRLDSSDRRSELEDLSVSQFSLWRRRETST